jgi:hypothetical protein
VQEKALVAAAASACSFTAPAGDAPGNCQQQEQQQLHPQQQQWVQQHSSLVSRGHKRQPLSLPPQRSTNEYLLDAAAESPGLPSGERRVPPKCSDSGWQPSGEGSWSIPSSMPQQQQQQLCMVAELAADMPLATETAAAAAVGGGGGGSFAEVIAALRLEGSLQQLPSAAAGGNGCNAVLHSRELPAAAAATAGSSGPSGSGTQRLPGIRQEQQQQQQATPRRRQQQQQETDPLAAFNPALVECQLKAKLEQVGASACLCFRNGRGSGTAGLHVAFQNAGGRHCELQHAA